MIRLYKTVFGAVIVSIFFMSAPVYAGPGKDLRQAAKAGDIKAVEFLLNKGVNPNAAGKKGGGTPLIKAAKGGHIDTVQLLLLYGADPKQKNKKGRSAIDIAERNEESVIASIMRNAIAEQAVTIGAKSLSQEKFINLIRDVLKGRGWRIDTTGQDKVTATYKRSERTYKVETSLSDGRVYIRFLRGYGARSSSYLNNLKLDLSKTL